MPLVTKQVGLRDADMGASCRGTVQHAIFAQHNFERWILRNTIFDDVSK